jgi:MSHA biogenesis protein MshG
VLVLIVTRLLTPALAFLKATANKFIIGNCTKPYLNQQSRLKPLLQPFFQNQHKPMPFFSYKGRDSKGSIIKGVLESQGTSVLAGQLLKQGITPFEIKPTAKPSYLINFFDEKVLTLDLMMFSRQMYALLKAGVPINNALSALHVSTRNKTFAKVIQSINDTLNSGHELSSALLQHPKIFDNFYINMIRVGETTGELDSSFFRLFEHLEFEKHIREQIKSALRYPSFVVLAIVIAMVIINIFVIPAFANMFAHFGAELPFVTRMLLGTSNFMIASWYYLLVAGIAIFYIFTNYTRSSVGKVQWDRFKLKIPVAGNIIYKATMARFARSFSLAGNSGVPIIEALGLVASTVDNAYIEQKITAMKIGIERGESILRTASNSGVFNALVLQMIAIGEESGTLEEMMSEVADMYQRDVEYEIKTLSTQIEPILIVCLGVMVLILALGIFLPMWSFGKVAIHHK